MSTMTLNLLEYLSLANVSLVLVIVATFVSFYMENIRLRQKIQEATSQKINEQRGAHQIQVPSAEPQDEQLSAVQLNQKRKSSRNDHDEIRPEYLSLLSRMQRLESYLTLSKRDSNGSIHTPTHIDPGVQHSLATTVDALIGDIDDQSTSPTVSAYGEEKLKDFQTTLDMICSAAMDPVIIIDEQGRIKSVNQEMLMLFEYQLWEVAGRNVKLIMPPELAEKHDKFLERYRLTKMKRIIGQVRTNIHGMKKSGSLVSVKLKVQQITDIHGTVYIGVIKDVGRDEELLRIRDMINQMLPKGYDEKISTGSMIAEHYTGAVLFVDLVGFTQFCSTSEPSQVISHLNSIFEAFDKIVKPLGIEKIKTIGDCYMAAAGVTGIMYDSAIRVLEAAIQILAFIEKNGQFAVRIGVATGKVVSGVLKGDKLTFDIWGDTVNVAARMQALAPVNGVRVCLNTYKQTKFMYVYNKCDELEVKGKGTLKTYELKGRKDL